MMDPRIADEIRSRWQAAVFYLAMAAMFSILTLIAWGVAIHPGKEAALAFVGIGMAGTVGFAIYSFCLLWQARRLKREAARSINGEPAKD